MLELRWAKYRHSVYGLIFEIMETDGGITESRIIGSAVDEVRV